MSQLCPATKEELQRNDKSKDIADTLDPVLKYSTVTDTRQKWTQEPHILIRNDGTKITSNTVSEQDNNTWQLTNTNKNTITTNCLQALMFIVNIPDHLD